MNYDNMLSLKSRLSNYNAGSWLDIAVGRGDFLKFGLESFQSWKSVVGIDIDSEGLGEARQKFVNTPVVLILGSALKCPFIDGYFDTITMSNALHHIEDLSSLFSETTRICKKNGFVIINEMLNESFLEIQETYMLYHKLIADIDNQLGHYHRDTFTFKEMLGMIKNPRLQLIDYFIHSETTGNAMDKAEVESISERLRKKVASLKGSDYYYFYENKARDITSLLNKTGLFRPRHITFFLQVL